MTRLSISAMQWCRVPDLRDVRPLDDADFACMADLRDVLLRHGRLGRFALHLVHRHFDVGAHEVLIEYSDPAARVQQLRVEPRDSATARGAVPTTWTLQTAAPMAACRCAYSVAQGHLARHESP